MTDSKSKKLNVGSKKTQQLKTDLLVVSKAEPQVTSNAMELEDGFQNLYDETILKPAIAPDKFYALVEENNTLAQCITAMEVNIDGTGYDVVRVDGKEIEEGKNDPKLDKIKQVLQEVYPEVSLTTLRRRLRTHAETCGYSCMEVIRNASGEIVFLRDLDSKNIRLVKLAEPTTATKSLTRGGVTAKVKIQVRERVFVQDINNKKVYFKQFGAQRDLDKTKGVWATKGTKLPAQNRASEVLYFTVAKSATTSYGVPRWLNQLPSVVGSREAEELNLSFFESGGIPPVMIFVSGGVMGETTKQNLNALLSGKAKDKLKGLVADVQSTGGTIDKAGAVKVTVESFGSDKQNDSMFENYDTKCEARVRGAFRLPPVFMGKVDEYSYASVFASYTVAEAQVFSPERMEWDELFNNTIMRELTNGEYKIVSKPLTVVDAETNIKALEVAADNNIISDAGLRNSLNKISSLDLPEVEEADKLKPVAPTDNEDNVTKSETTIDGLYHLSDIAELQTKALMKTITESQQEELQTLVSKLSDKDKEVVALLTSNKLYASVSNDSEGMAELCGCVVDHD